MRLKTIYHRNGASEHFIDGVPATQEEVDAAFPSKPIGLPLLAQTSSCWPMKSDALAVHPKQIEQVRARNKKHGLNIEYAPDGRPILQDRGMRRDLMKIEGVHDNNGGYGDDHASHGGYLGEKGSDAPFDFEGV